MSVACKLVKFNQWLGETFPGGYLGREVPPGPSNPDPVCDKKFMKIMEN